jgi:hypothetical protein
MFETTVKTPLTNRITILNVKEAIAKVTAKLRDGLVFLISISIVISLPFTENC